MRIFLCLLMASLAPVWAANEHNPLLPRPQEIRYGAGSLALKGASIWLSPASTPEDRFAAGRMATCLAERTEASPEILEGRRAYRGDFAVDERTGAAKIVGGAGAGPAIVLTRTGGVSPLAGLDERPGPESREAYWLKVTGGGVELRAVSSAGLFYGAETICQLVEGDGAGAVLPEVDIHDWPAIAYRGTMVDLSHGQLHTEEEIKRQIDFMAWWKANQYYFYSEVSIELDGFELLSPEGRYTKEQVRRIIEYGRERHVDVIPCLELYGHLHDLLRIERYSDLGAFPHGGELDPRNPKGMELMRDWADQYVRLFPSPFVHIGFDETWQIAEAAKKQGAGASPAKLFLEQLKGVAALYQQGGKRVMFWGDIPLDYPDILAEMPPGVIAVAWEYDPVHDFIGHWLEPFKKRNVPTIIATGVSNWRELTPDLDFTFGNIDNFLGAARKTGVLGMMNTLWADSGFQLQRMAWPAVAYGSVAPWSSQPVDRARFFSDYARILYPRDAAPHVAAALDKLNRAEVELQKALSQETFWEVWEDPFSAKNLKRSADHRQNLRQARLLSEDAQEHLYRALARKADPSLLNSLLVGSRLVNYAGAKFLNALEIAERWQDLSKGFDQRQLWNMLESEVSYQSHGRLSDMMDAATEIRKAYRKAWLEENTDYRLEAALGRFDGEYEYWRRLQIRLRVALQGLGDKKTLPPLDSALGPR